MDRLITVNAVLAGFFAFAAIHYAIQWWFSRNERLLLVFAVQCAMYAVFCWTIIAFFQATTIPETQAALDRTITLGLLIHGVILQFYAHLGGRRDRVFRALVLGLLVLLRRPEPVGAAAGNRARAATDATALAAARACFRSARPPARPSPSPISSCWRSRFMDSSSPARSGSATGQARSSSPSARRRSCSESRSGSSSTSRRCGRRTRAPSRT